MHRCLFKGEGAMDRGHRNHTACAGARELQLYRCQPTPLDEYRQNMLEKDAPSPRRSSRLVLWTTVEDTISTCRNQGRSTSCQHGVRITELRRWSPCRDAEATLHYGTFSADKAIES